MITKLLILLSLLSLGCTQNWYQSIHSIDNWPPPNVDKKLAYRLLMYNLEHTTDLDDDIEDYDEELEFTRDEAFWYLLNTETFGHEAVGEGGETSEEVIAFRTLLKEEDSNAIFKNLFERAKMPGKLYSLCAFKLNSKDDYQIFEPKLLHSKDKVVEFSGCEILYKPVSDIIAKEISTGALPKQFTEVHEEE